MKSNKHFLIFFFDLLIDFSRPTSVDEEAVEEIENFSGACFLSSEGCKGDEEELGRCDLGLDLEEGDQDVLAAIFRGLYDREAIDRIRAVCFNPEDGVGTLALVRFSTAGRCPAIAASPRSGRPKSKKKRLQLLDRGRTRTFFRLQNGAKFETDSWLKE